MRRLLGFLYSIGTIATFVWLIVYPQHSLYHGWNWFIRIPVDLFLASLWPLYWAIHVWLQGGRLPF